MFIQTEETPNPQALKFMPGRQIMGGESIEFTPDQKSDNILIQNLFKIQGVVTIFAGHDFLSITKNSVYEWFTLKPQILEQMVHFFTTHKDLGVTAKAAENILSDSEMAEVEKEICELLDTRIRPAVAMDGGDITFVKFDEGIVYLQLKGACSGCPSSSITLKSGIENMLKHYIPEVQEVRAINDGET